jgi:hypothetical protein
MYAVNILAVKLDSPSKVEQVTAIQGHPKWPDHVPTIIILERRTPL